jgi:hypothetical protein
MVVATIASSGAIATRWQIGGFSSQHASWFKGSATISVSAKLGALPSVSIPARLRSSEFVMPTHLFLARIS